MRFNPGDRVEAFGGAVTGTFYGYYTHESGCNCSIIRDDHIAGGGPERSWLMNDRDLKSLVPEPEIKPQSLQDDLFWQEE